MVTCRIMVLLALVPCALSAQDSSGVTKAPARGSDGPPLTFGITSGSMSFADARVQQGVTGALRYRFAGSLSIVASPTYARMSFPASLGGGAVNGLTDLPIELDADRAFQAAPWSPTIGLALGATLPTGNQTIGFGSGAMGANVGFGVGASPTDALSLHVGAGKPLTDYSDVGALGTSGSAWGDAEVSYQLLSHVEATVGFDGDLASRDTLGAARAVALSVTTTVAGPFAVTVSGGHGISGAAARWTLALGMGTDYAGLESLGSSSPIQRFFRAMGGGSHKYSGSSNPGSGHGRP